MTLSDELLYLILQHVRCFIYLNSSLSLTLAKQLHGPQRPNQALCSVNHVCRRLHGISKSFLFEHVTIDLGTTHDKLKPLPKTKDPVHRIERINLAAVSRLRHTMTLLQQSGAFSLVRHLTLHLTLYLRSGKNSSAPVASKLEELVKRLVNLRSIQYVTRLLSFP